MGLVYLRMFMNLIMNHGSISGNETTRFHWHLPYYLSSPPVSPTQGSGKEVPTEVTIWE